jgi:hypothetical protein
MLSRRMWAMTLFFAVSTTLTAFTEAGGQIIATPNIEQLCRSAPVLTYRRTVVYIDLATVRNANSEWGLTILNRLEIVPRESLTIISVNPNTFETTEVFDACYPVLSAPEIEEARKSRGFLERLISLDPVDQQRENLQTFDARLRNALDKIVEQSKKYEEGRRRNVLDAIALDKNRYSDRNVFYRVVVYTDGTIKEPNAPATMPVTSDIAKSLAEKYPASFSGAEVGVFGIDSSQDGASPSREQTFATFFLKNWGHLKSFSFSLPQQENFIFPPAIRMDGVFEGGGTQGAVKLALFAAKQGNVANGWLAFNVGREMLYVPFQGEFRCANDDCRLNAAASESIPPESQTPYFRKGDRIDIKSSGNNRRSLEGALEAESREVFKGGNERAKYALKFSAE